MISTQNRVIVSEGPCEAHGGAHICIYHRDFPENWSPGETPAMAARQLLNLFEKNLDSAGDPSHRQSIELAIADLWAFLRECDQNHEPTA
ncbi:hypothetical protein [Tautonia rosea]|uniref:hypothetical protein n=1 Tax=Tautonia rosea TaxID=2728037 RepID=UPI001473761E|nr:hypothetical protein [Tautonia rosea]